MDSGDIYNLHSKNMTELEVFVLCDVSFFVQKSAKRMCLYAVILGRGSTTYLREGTSIPEAKLSSPGKFALICAFLVPLRLSLKLLSHSSAIPRNQKLFTVK